MRTSLCAAPFQSGKRTSIFPRAGAALSIASLIALAFVFADAREANGGCTDYGSILSSACDGCASSCNGLAAAGAGCGCGDTGGGGCGGAGLSDYVLGSCGCGGSNGGCTGCGGSGLGGNFWNALFGSRCGGGLGGGLLNCRPSACGGGGLLSGSCGGGCGGGLLSGLLSGGGCGGGCGDMTPGAGTQGDAPAVFCGMPAPSYPVPYAVPSYVGHTEFAYPPFMPHHSLPHYRKIYSYRHAPGMSRTNVHWRTTTGRNILARLHNMIELPR